MSARHTPLHPPWRYDQEDGVVEDSRGLVVANVGHGSGALVVARLIAAAPDMLAVLKEIAAESGPWQGVARDVVAKAEGKKMAYFDRFDICEAHYVMEVQWHNGGWLRERLSNQRRREATSIQLARIHFQPAPSLCDFNGLTDNGKEIYYDLMKRYGFEDPEVEAWFAKHGGSK